MTGKLQMSFKDIIFVVAIIMNRHEKVFLFLLCLMAAISLHAQSFADYFADKTLRVDYIFTGNAAKQEICLDGLSCLLSLIHILVFKAQLGIGTCPVVSIQTDSLVLQLR